MSVFERIPEGEDLLYASLAGFVRQAARLIAAHRFVVGMLLFAIGTNVALVTAAVNIDVPPPASLKTQAQQALPAPNLVESIPLPPITEVVLPAGTTDLRSANSESNASQTAPLVPQRGQGLLTRAYAPSLQYIGGSTTAARALGAGPTAPAAVVSAPPVATPAPPPAAAPVAPPVVVPAPVPAPAPVQSPAATSPSPASAPVPSPATGPAPPPASAPPPTAS